MREILHCDILFSPQFVLEVRVELLVSGHKILLYLGRLASDPDLVDY